MKVIMKGLCMSQATVRKNHNQRFDPKKKNISFISCDIVVKNICR
jgi:hypothetical protein